jgi:hypothetical protein
MSMSPFARANGARAHHLTAQSRTMFLAGAACTGLLLLAACSGGATGGGASTRRLAAVPYHAAHGPAGAPAAAPSAGFSGSVTGNARLVLSNQSIIYTADLALRVKDVTTAATLVTGIATDAGGYIASEQDTIPHGGSAAPRVIIELKIPVAQYHQALGKLSGTIGSPLFFNQRAQDVTQRVADVSSRVASARTAITQLRALLRRAGSVGALLQVQDEINTQQSALESLLAQQQALSHETSYGTVTVTLLGHHAALVKKQKKKAHGFVTGLRSGWHALGVVVTWVLTALGALLPFLIPIALLAALAFELRRWLRRRKAHAAADPPATAES